MSAVISPASNAHRCSFSNSASEFTDTQIFLKRPHSQGSFRASKEIIKASPSRRAPLRMARIDACAPCATILPLLVFRSFRKTMTCLCSIDALYLKKASVGAKTSRCITQDFLSSQQRTKASRSSRSDDVPCAAIHGDQSRAVWGTFDGCPRTAMPKSMSHIGDTCTEYLPAVSCWTSLLNMRCLQQFGSLETIMRHLLETSTMDARR